MYPRVRVKEPEDPVSRQKVAAAYLLRVIESLSLEGNGPVIPSASDHLSKGNIDPNKSYVRDPHPNPKNRPSTSTPNEKSVKGADEDNRNNIRASSVPRPRAVLSSPDNDDIIGNQNKRIQERRRSAKGQAPDNYRMTNRHSPVTGKRTASSTQCSYIKTQANTLHKDHRAEGQPFSLNSHIQPNANNSDLKQPQTYRNTPPRANHSDFRLQRSSNKRSFFSEAGGSNGYPKISVQIPDTKAKNTN